MVAEGEEDPVWSTREMVEASTTMRLGTGTFSQGAPRIPGDRALSPAHTA